MGRRWAVAAGVAAMLLAGLALLMAINSAASALAPRPNPPPSLSTVPPSSLQQAGVVLEPAPARPPWCGAVDALPLGRPGGAIAEFCPRTISRQEAIQALAKVGRKPIEMVLAQCTVRSARIDHRPCWAATVAFANAKLPPGVVGGPIKPLPPNYGLVSFVDARTGQVLGELLVRTTPTRTPGLGI